MINVSEAFFEFVDAFVSAYDEPLNDPNVWYVKQKKYNQLRWLKHCAKVYHDAPRKLRKCEIRRMVKRRRNESKRYE
jgi:hypothetical protein